MLQLCPYLETERDSYLLPHTARKRKKCWCHKHYWKWNLAKPLGLSSIPRGWCGILEDYQWQGLQALTKRKDICPETLREFLDQGKCVPCQITCFNSRGFFGDIVCECWSASPDLACEHCWHHSTKWNDLELKSKNWCTSHRMKLRYFLIFISCKKRT